MDATDQTPARDSRRRARRLRTLAAPLSLVLLAACAQDPRREIRQEAQTLSSWAATLHLVADSWREGSVPTPYAKKAVEAARATLRDEAKSIQGSSTMPADARAAFAERARGLGELADSMSRIVEGEDRAAAGQLVVGLSGEEQSLKDLAQKAGARAR
jgi:hypothetical protein